MAKRKREVNKSQLIRDALAANPGKSPAEISAILKEQGLAISPQYVSTIKSNAKTKIKKKQKTVRVARGAKSQPAQSSVLNAALDFLKAAGSMQDAKKALQSLEEIGKLVR